MNKKFLKEIKNKLETKEITPDEVYTVVEDFTQIKKLESKQKTKSIIKLDFLSVISFVGGALILLGLVFLVSLFWSELGDFGQVFVLLGGGFMAYITGSLLLFALSNKTPGLSIHLAGFVFIPTGLFVTFSKFLYPNPNLINLVASGIFLICFILYALTDYFSKKNIFTLATWLFGSISSIISLLEIFNRFLVGGDNFYIWQASLPFVFTGGSGLLFSYCLSDKSLKKRTSFVIIRAFSITTIYLSLFSLAVNKTFLEIIFILFLAGGLYLSYFWQSTTTLILVSLLSLVYIFYLNSRYFSQILGWPVTLILSGVILVLISFFAVKFRQKYFLQN